MGNEPADDISQIYENLWNLNIPRITAGDVEIDPWLTDPENDRRRGLTLIFRPPNSVIMEIMEFLESCRILEPDQFFYQPDNLHFTVLSLFTVKEEFHKEYQNLPGFISSIKESLEDSCSFNLKLRGLTVSPGAVMICGYPDTELVNLWRERLRGNLKLHGLADGLDKRYHLMTAHCTILRFSSSLRNPLAFSKFLSIQKLRDFGIFHVSQLELVKNDWYMGARNTELIERYFLNYG